MRLQSQMDTCTYTIYNYTRRGLFDKDKLIVSSLITLSILNKDGLLNLEEYNMLLTAPQKKNAPSVADQPEFSGWMSDSQYASVLSLETLACFAGLAKDMEKVG